MIVDLSFPRGHSINDGVSTELSSISYASVDDAVNLILQLGRGTQLVKLDLKNAYHIVPVHPHDQHLLAVSWDRGIYVDRALPFGLRSAPKIFSAVADMMAWALHCAGVKHQIHYLEPQTATRKHSHSPPLGQCYITVAEHKMEGPST